LVKLSIGRKYSVIPVVAAPTVRVRQQLCEWKGVEIIEAEVCPDHIHMLIKIPPKQSVSSFTVIPERQKQADDIRAMA
jgi:putative transposase